MENTEKMIFPGEGRFHIPIIKPETDIRIDKLEWIPVNYALTAKDKATKGVHFYKDDYQFERFWNNPDKYIPLLQQFGAVCSPDFSLYSDMPLAVQLLEQLEENTEIYKTQVVLFLLKWRKNFLRTIKCRLYPNQKWMK